MVALPQGHFEEQMVDKTLACSSLTALVHMTINMVTSEMKVTKQTRN